MEPSTDDCEVVHDFSPRFRVYKDGRVERLKLTETIPAINNRQTGVKSKDAVISPETGVGARLFIPKITDPTQKLPLLVYYHGGAFCLGSAFSAVYHHYLSSLSSEANTVVVSVDYRLDPEHPLPIAFDDSWVALQWVASHSAGHGPEEWLNRHADFDRVFLGGDSAGATLAQNMAVQVGANGLEGVKLAGLILVHPYFETNSDGTVSSELQKYLYPTCAWASDMRFNPAIDPSLPGLGCDRVVVVVAEMDMLRERGYSYCEVLKQSGWGGVVEIVETEGEDHVFHLFNPGCDKALKLLKLVTSFISSC